MKRMRIIAPVVLCLLLAAGYTLVAGPAPAATPQVAISPAQEAAPAVTLEPLEAEAALLASGEVTGEALECIYCISAIDCSYAGEVCNRFQRCRCGYCNGMLGCLN